MFRLHFFALSILARSSVLWNFRLNRFMPIELPIGFSTHFFLHFYFACRRNVLSPWAHFVYHCFWRSNGWAFNLPFSTYTRFNARIYSITMVNAMLSVEINWVSFPCLTSIMSDRRWYSINAKDFSIPSFDWMGEELDDLPFLVFTLIFNTIQVHVTNLAENSSRCLF